MYQNFLDECILYFIFLCKAIIMQMKPHFVFIFSFLIFFFILWVEGLEILDHLLFRFSDQFKYICRYLCVSFNFI